MALDIKKLQTKANEITQNKIVENRKIIENRNELISKLNKRASNMSAYKDFENKIAVMGRTYGVVYDNEIWNSQEEYEKEAAALYADINTTFEKHLKGETTNSELMALGAKKKKFEEREKVYFSDEWQAKGTIENSDTLKRMWDKEKKANYSANSEIDHQMSMLSTDDENYVSKLKELEAKRNEVNREAYILQNKLEKTKEYEAYSELEKKYADYKTEYDNAVSTGDTATHARRDALQYLYDHSNRNSERRIHKDEHGNPVGIRYNEDGTIDTFATQSALMNSECYDEIDILNKYGTDEQINIFVYLYNKYGEDNARKYAKEIKPLTNDNAAKKAYEDYKKANDAERFFLGAGNMIAGGLSDAGQGLSGAVKALTGNTSYTFPTTAQAKASGTREAEDGFVAGALMDLTRSTSNMAPSVALSFANPVLGSVSFATSAGGNAYIDAINSGHSWGESLVYGAASGASEVLLQKFLGGNIPGFGASGASRIANKSIGNAITTKVNDFLKGTIKSAKLRRVMSVTGHYLGSMGSEFVEEALQEILDPIYRNAFLGEKNDVFTSEKMSEALYAGFIGLMMAGTLNIPDSYTKNSTLKKVFERTGAMTSEDLNYIIKDESTRMLFENITGLKLDKNEIIARVQIASFNRGFAKKGFKFDSDTQTKIEKLSTEGKSVEEIVENLAEDLAIDTQADNNSKITEKKLEETSSIEPEKPIEDYPYNMREVLEDYVNYRNPKINKYVNDVLYGENKQKVLQLENVNDKAASEIQRITGVNAHGFKTALENRIVEHIEDRHGKNGKADQSMSNIEDWERIQYVLNNFDSISPSGNSSAYTTMKKNGHSGLAKTVTYSKAINGTFYVIEAVPDTKAKTVYVVSAFITKSQNGLDGSGDVTSPAVTSVTNSATTHLREDDTQALNAADATLSSKSSETPLASPPSDNSISNENEQNSSENVKNPLAYNPWANIGTKDTRRTGKNLGVDEKTIETICRISEVLNVPILFYEGKTVNGAAENGFHENGILYLNIHTKRKLEWVIAHELTHFIEKASDYSRIKRMILETIDDDAKSTHGKSVSDMIADKKALYAKRKKKLSKEAAEREIVADYIADKLLTDEKAIRKMVSENRSFGEKVIDFLGRIIARLSGKSNEAAYLENLRTLYRKALAETIENQAVSSYGERSNTIHTNINEALESDSYLNELRKKLEAGEITDEEATRDFDRYIAQNPTLQKLIRESTEHRFGDGYDMQSSFESAQEEEQRQYSFDEYAEEIDTWEKDGMPNGESFILGMTGDVLQGLGAIESDIYMLGDKIKEILREHSEMTLAEIKKIPQILNDPILILKSRNAGRNDKRNSRLVIFGNIKAQDGRPILTALDLRPIENNLVVNDMQKVSSAYTKDSNPVEFVKNSLVVFADKKRTTKLLKSIGFQMPIELQQSGYIGSISYFKRSVNIHGKTFSEIFKETDEKTSNKSTADSKLTHYGTRKYSYDDIPPSAELDEKDIRIAELEAELSSYREKEEKTKERSKSYREKKKGEHKQATNKNDAERQKNLRAVYDAFNIQTDFGDISQKSDDEIISIWKDFERLTGKVARIKFFKNLSLKDNNQVNDLLRGDKTIDDILALDSNTYNINGILSLAAAKLEYEITANQLSAYKKMHKERLRTQAARLLNRVKILDDKAGILYNRETMERNIRDVLLDWKSNKDKDLATDFIKTYFLPVHQNEASRNKYKEKYFDRIRSLDISEKAAGKNQVSEAYAVQFLGEVDSYIVYLENHKGTADLREGKTLDEWKATKEKFLANNPDLDIDKIENAVEVFREIYNEIFIDLNKVRIRNGYPPIPYREGYFPHFTEAGNDDLLGKICKAFGINNDVTELPTTINGITHTFRPGIRWMGNALERTGYETMYDALKGFDKYMEAASDVIFHTDDIQRLRALTNQMRYNASEEGMKKRADYINNMDNISEEERQSLLDNLHTNGRFTGSNLVVALEEYTNLLANKKSLSDRGMEQKFGRRAYNIVKGFESRVAANMIVGNISSYLTNFIPIVQGYSLISSKSIIRGLWHTLVSMKKADEIAYSSYFIVNRKGAQPLSRSRAEKFSEFLLKPMEFIDSLATGTIVRGRYYDNIKRGLSEELALEEADDFAARVIADRSKGSMPTLFNQKNPATKLFTQFQLEVNNQFSFLFKDLPDEAKERGLKVLALALFKFCLASFLFNDLFEYLFGRRPALDPIGILNDFVGDLTGKKLPNVIDAMTELFDGDEEFFKFDEVKKAGLGRGVKGLSENILENTPFIGGVLGGGRVPLSSAIPDISNIITSVTGTADAKKKASVVSKELMKPVYYSLLPFGGGVVKKAAEGIPAVLEGGSYFINSKGEKELQYPISNNTPADLAGNITKSVLFGKTSTKGGKEWVKDDFGRLNANYTKVYDAITEFGIDEEEAYDFLKEMNEIKKDDEHGESELKRDYLYSSEFPNTIKAVIYYGTLANNKEKDILEAHTEKKSIGEVYKVLNSLKNCQYKTEKMSAINKSKLIKDDKISIYQNLVCSSDTIKKYTDEGLSTKTALNISYEIDCLKKNEDSDRIPEKQQAAAIVNMNLGYDSTMKALKATVSEKEFKRLSFLKKYKLELKYWYELNEIAEKINKTGKYGTGGTGIDNTETEIAVRTIAEKYGLNQSQMSVLWQLFTGSKSTKNNVFNQTAGQNVIDYMNAEE